MVTQTTTTLPPPFITGLGENFSAALTGATDASGKPIFDIGTAPFAADPSTYLGPQFVAGQDQFTTDAQALAPGLGGYEPFLQQAKDLTGIAQGLVVDPATGQVRPQPGAAALGQAQGLADLAGTAATTGQDAGAAGIAAAQNIANQMQAAATAGQGAGTPFLQSAQGFMGPDAFQQFMSPYQQQVIDATMSQFDRDLQQQQAQLGASAGSAFGGGRFGVAQGELAAQGALDKALTGAQLRQQGFGLANQLAAQAAQQQLASGQFAQGQAAQNLGLLGSGMQGQLQAAGAAGNQAAQNVALAGQASGFQQNMSNLANQQLANQLSQLGGLSAAQQGLGQFDISMLGNQINALSQIGSQNQAYQQAIKDAEQAKAQGIELSPQQNLGFFGQMLGAAYGAPGGTTFQTTPDPSTLQTLLGAGTGILGILGAGGFFNRGQGQTV